MTKISVIMSVFNGAEYVGQAVESILNQTFHDFEFIIVDDGSTDNSLEIIERYKDQRIKIIRNTANRGLPESLNLAIGSSNGIYIARQDADDLSHPNRLERQLLELTERNFDIIGCESVNIDINGRPFSISTQVSVKVSLQHLLSCKNCMLFAHGTAFMRKDSLIKVGLYNEGFFFAQDLELWARFLDNGMKIGCLEEPLYCLRRLPQTNDRKSYAQGLYRNCLAKYYKDHTRSYLNLSTKLVEVNEYIMNRHPVVNNNSISDYWYYCATTCLIESHNRKQAGEYFIKAIIHNRSPLRLAVYFIGLLSLSLPIEIIAIIRGKSMLL